MKRILNASQMREADSRTSSEFGISSIVLMERAALFLADAAEAAVSVSLKHTPSVLCIAGKGNNGADAVAAGRILADRGMKVDFYVMSDTPDNGSAMAVQQSTVRAYGLSITLISKDEIRKITENKYDVIIEGLFGTGLSRNVEGLYCDVINAVNTAGDNGSYIIAADIPSGISSDTGKVLGCAVKADETVTFAYMKRGMYLYPGTDYCGKITVADIGITDRSLKDSSTWYTYDTETADELLPLRKGSGNKGTFGKVLVIAGAVNMCGAAVMCASACERTGCGMVKVFTEEENRTIIQTTVPSALLTTWSRKDMDETLSRLSGDLSWADVCVIGPGLSRTEETAALLKSVLEYRGIKHIVIDADAVRMIRDNDMYEYLRTSGKESDIIMTPHLAECAYLLNLSVKDLAIDRDITIKEFADTYHVTLVCKDSRTMIVQDKISRLFLVTNGNDGMATAGSGDVLCGIVASLCAQGMSGIDAAAAAAYLHAKAAVNAEKLTDKRGLTAPDIYRYMNEKL